MSALKIKLRAQKARLRWQQGQLDKQLSSRDALTKRIEKARRRIERLRKELADAKGRQISDRGLRLVASFEGWYDRPYNDPVGHCTVGFGHLIHRGGCTKADFAYWGTLSKDEGYDLLRKDLREASDAVTRLTKVTLTQGQFDALCSFVFNVGAGAYGSSTMLRKLNEARDYKGAADEFPKWVYADGQKLAGLVRRREAERKLFLEG